jgi:hypothetical protein
VLGFAVLATGWAARDLIRIKIASTLLHVPPKDQKAGEDSLAPIFGLRGDAPWALSALPECLIQTSETTGPKGYVLAHLPSGLEPVDPHAVLKYGNCTISVRGDEAFVDRGPDRFRIPPRVRFFRGPGTLALLREDTVGNQLRVYQTPSPAEH